MLSGDYSFFLVFCVSATSLFIFLVGGIIYGIIKYKRERHNNIVKVAILEAGATKKINYQDPSIGAKKLPSAYFENEIDKLVESRKVATKDRRTRERKLLRQKK